MSNAFYHTVVRRDKGMWIALRMCEDHELYRAHGKTYKEARKNLRMLMIPEFIRKPFDAR